MSTVDIKVNNSQKCPACKFGDFKIIYELPYGKVVSCKDCDLAFTIFTDIETFREANKTWSNPEQIKSAIYALPIARENVKYRMNLINKFSKGKKLIEFGPNTGEFIYEAHKNGYDITAVDHCFAILMLNKIQNLKYLNADANLSNINEKYDVVVACHILEHMEDPQAFILKSKQILNTNGILFIEVPNYDSFTRKVEGKEWHLFYEYHITHFSSTSLTDLLKKQGFKIRFVKTLQSPECFISNVYLLLRHSLWTLVKKILPVKEIELQKRNYNILESENHFVESLQEEKKILNSFRGRIYRLEIRVKKIFCSVFFPFAWLISKFNKGDILVVIAEI